MGVNSLQEMLDQTGNTVALPPGGFGVRGAQPVPGAEFGTAYGQAANG
jgi:hypothetical protein